MKTTEKKHKVIGVIGIRAGSKGIPNKNIKLLSGKPLFQWILDTAKKSKYIERVLISTDSKEYAGMARDLGAEVPYIRPEYLAADNSQEYDFVKHMIDWLDKNENYQPDVVVRMLATTPLQKIEDIDASIKKLISNAELDSTVVIAEARQHPKKALKIVQDSQNQEKLVSYFSESGREVTPTSRQSYEKAYFRGNVITFKPRVMENTKSLTGDNVGYIVTTQESSIDIDNPIDFEFVEYLINRNKDL